MRGRRRKGDIAPRRTITLGVRVTLQERTLLEGAAQAAGLDLSEWLRTIALLTVMRSQGAREKKALLLKREAV